MLLKVTQFRPMLNAITNVLALFEPLDMQTSRSVHVPAPDGNLSGSVELCCGRTSAVLVKVPCVNSTSSSHVKVLVCDCFEVSCILLALLSTLLAYMRMAIAT